MQTNLCAHSHGNSASTGLTTNYHRDQTSKGTAVCIINHIFNATG